jgi:hypothetical protein
MAFYKKYHITEHPIPEGFQIYSEALMVQGIAFRKKNAMKFAKASVSKPVCLIFEHEPDNPEDKNAIKIIGCISERKGIKKIHLGYVERELAKWIVENNMIESVAPRLWKTYAETKKDGYIEIGYQLVGSKEMKKGFTSHVNNLHSL